MTDNIYAAPEAEVVDTGNENTDGPQQFYIVSNKKFLVLYIATIGIYGVYWHYKNWAYNKAANNSNIWPIPRAIFNIFFTHSLFRTVDERITSTGKTWAWNPAGLATAWVLLSITNNVVDRLVASGALSETIGMLSVLSFPAMAYVAYSAQKAINTAEGDAEGESNSTFTAANIAWTVVGVLCWGLVGFGLFAIAEGY